MSSRTEVATWFRSLQATYVRDPRRVVGLLVDRAQIRRRQTFWVRAQGPALGLGIPIAASTDRWDRRKLADPVPWTRSHRSFVPAMGHVERAQTLATALRAGFRPPGGRPTKLVSTMLADLASGTTSDRAEISLIGRVRRIGAIERPPERYELPIRVGLLDETLKLAPYSVITQLIVAVTITFFFWSTVSHAYLLGLLGVVTMGFVATIYTSRRYRCTNTGGVSEAAVSRGYRISTMLAFALGLAWATMPIVLYAPSGDQRQLVVAIAAGLIADAYVAGPLLSVSYLFAIPLILGSFIGLARSGEPVAVSIAVLLLWYAIFVLASVNRMSRLSFQRVLDRVRVEDQGQTIALLLNEFEENASDWLWETDAIGRFQHVSARMAEALGSSIEALRHASFMTLLSDRTRSRPEAQEAADRFPQIAQCLPFHGHLVDIDTSAGPRWLRLSGKPFLDHRGAFAGFRGVGSDVTESREAEARITYLATHDALTGLPNRATFHAVLLEGCTAQAPDELVSLLYLDLDGFKIVNDSAGHTAGDELLRQVSARLLSATGPEARVFRLGGDEFAVVHRGLELWEAEYLAGTVLSILREPYLIEGVRAEIGASVGIARAPRDATDPVGLLRKADLALYKAKEAGRGRWQDFDPSLEQRAQRWRELDDAMRAGLDGGEMELHYQPLVSLSDGSVVGCEALLRWTRPGHGPVSPAEMIPIAEGTGFIVAIGRWALRKACAEALSWPRHMRVGVNISSIHFRHPDFYDEVEAVLGKVGLAPERLEIEITESIFLANIPYVLDNLRRLRMLGVRIALDDFGTGYSSLSYLTQFPVDKIKIDRAFVSDMGSRRECLVVIEAIMVIARDLDMDVTAEGVETVEQAELLRHRGCNSVQGFLYSPARPPRDIPGLIESLPEVDRALRFALPPVPDHPVVQGPVGKSYWSDTALVPPHASGALLSEVDRHRENLFVEPTFR